MGINSFYCSGFNRAANRSILNGRRKQAGYYGFLETLKKEPNYSFKGIISDMNENIIKAVKEKMPNIPHQFCLTHILRGIDRITEY